MWVLVVPLPLMRGKKLSHLHTCLILTLKCIVEMRGEERKRRAFAYEVFVRTNEKNTEGGKYNSPEGLYPQKCLCITQKSIAMQTLYTV